MKQREYYVYIMASYNKCLYVGVTNNLMRRVQEHKNKINLGSFTARYQVNRLVYFESTNSIIAAIAREKQIKKYNRQWKINLIEAENSNWVDLSEEWQEQISGTSPKMTNKASPLKMMNKSLNMTK